MRDVQVRTLVSAAADLRAGRVTSGELVEEALAAADADDARLGVFASRWAASARAAAEVADRDFTRGVDRGALQGIPIGVKDLISTAEEPARAGSRVLDPAWGTGHGDAACVAGLRATGAVLVGATVTSEFGLGSPDPGSGRPLPRNPWDDRRWTGGSSAGSASAVLTGMALGALGTDSGGSIRMPAAFCGVTGFKPTFGRVPTTGCLPLGWTTDTVGVLAAGAADCAALFAAVAEPADPVEVPPTGSGLAGVRIGVDRLEDAGGAFVDSAWEARWTELAGVLTAAGATLTDVRLPLEPELAAASVVITLSEGLAGHRATLGARWDEHLPNTRATLALATSFSGADYVQAQRVRRAAQRAVTALFADVDLVLTPTAAGTATPFERLDAMFASGEFASVHAPYWNLTGGPALSIPVGPGLNGLPLGLQISGPAGADMRVLTAGTALQERSSWHLARPHSLPVPGVTTAGARSRPLDEKEHIPCPTTA